MKNLSITISPVSILLVLGIVLGIAFLSKIMPILVALFLAFILMSALNPGVNLLEKQKIPRAAAILLSYLIVFFIISVLIALVIPPLAGEFAGLVRTLQIPNLPSELTTLKLTMSDLSSLVSQLGSSVGSVISAITSTFSTALFLVTIFVMTFFLLLERYEYKKYFWTNKNERADRVIEESAGLLGVQLGSWVRGQIALMFTIGIVTFIVLTLLGIPYALPLAVLAGLLEILPNLGPTISSIPAIVVAFLLVSPTMAGVVTLAYIVIQQLENNLIAPRIMKAAVNVEPLISIVLILIGIQVGGVIGALLSVPIFLVARTLFFVYLRETGKLKK